MEIGENGLLNFSEVKDLTNEQIIWLYLSLRVSYISRKEEYRKKMKQLEGLQAMMKAMMEDEEGENAETAKKINEKVQELKKEGEEFPEDKYIVSICNFLKPKFFLIKGADEDLVNSIVKDCFNESNKVLQRVLVESEDSE